MKKITDRDFKREVLEAEKPVVVCFTARYCGTCFPTCLVTRELSEEYGDTFKFVRLDVDEISREIVAGNHVTAVPTVLIFENAREVRRLVGFQDRSELRDILAAWPGDVNYLTG